MKFRTDFVTNSSSSSFVIYSIYDRELVDFVKELIRTGKVNNFLNHPDPDTIWGYKACESLELTYSLRITRQIAQMSAAPYNMQVYRAEETGEYYSLADLKADCRKMLKEPIILEAIKTFFDLTKEDKERLKGFVEKAVADNKVSCGVFMDETDGFAGYMGSMYSLCDLQPDKKRNNPIVPVKEDAIIVGTDSNPDSVGIDSMSSSAHSLSKESSLGSNKDTKTSTNEHTVARSSSGAAKNKKKIKEYAQRLASVMNALNEKYTPEKKKPANLVQFMIQNPDVDMKKLEIWTKSLYEIGALDYLIQQGIIVLNDEIIK